MTKTTINIELLGKTYPIKCSPQEVESLQEAAKLLETKMQTTKDVTQVLSHDKIAVLTSLQLAHELLLMEKGALQFKTSVEERLSKLQTAMEDAAQDKKKYASA